MRQLFLSVLILFSSYVYAGQESCILKIGEPVVKLHDFGFIPIAEFSESYIWLDSAAGNVIPADLQGHSDTTFNFNTLYRVSDAKGEAWYFRFAGAAWFPDKQRVGLYSLEWADKRRPQGRGKFRIEAVRAHRQQLGEKTFATVGDSMVWFGEAQMFRCALSQVIPGYRFVGSNTDHFGYGHDGHGGDSSGEVLARIDSVASADVYFLLVGSNDGGYYPNGTAKNISGIVKTLLSKRKDSRVIVSTLPVRGDQYAELVPKRNGAIRAWYAKCNCKDRVVLIDTSAAMANEKDAIKRFITLDQIHPSSDGYRFLAALIARAIGDDVTKVATTSANSPRSGTTARPSVGP